MTILSQGYISNIRPLNVRDKEHNNSAFRGDMIWGNAFFPEFSCDHPLVMTTTFSQG
jgi:hypothetical protein